MDRVFLSWTPENWLTVVIMGGLGFAVASLIAQLVRQFIVSGPR